MRLIRASIAALLLCAGFAAKTQAHPLGNFTINHLARITATSQEIRVRYVLDIAEIPAFQIMHAPGTGDWTARRMQLWAGDERSVVLSGFHLTVDGTAAGLTALPAHAELRPGAGGLPILRWVGTFIAPITVSRMHTVHATDRVYSDRRIGWKDIALGTQSEPTDELRRYPSALIGTPRRVNGAAFTIEPGGRIQNVVVETDAAPAIGTLTSWTAPATLSDMFARTDRTLSFMLLTILAAFGLGALHAVEPGHGKALLAFTLVGARATTKQAVILAASLTFAHTAGVLLLGMVLFLASGFVSESIYPWITLVSGIVIAIIGARALGRFAHAHDHAHTHERHGVSGLNFGSAVSAAMSGGIAPCPAAIVVLLTALRLHQTAYGTLLIVVFSMGLAAVLTGLGIGVVHGAASLSRRSVYTRFAPYGPLVTALVISLIGAWTLGTGLAQQGAAPSAVLPAVFTFAAIGGYALARRGHTHTHAAPAAEGT